MSLDAVAVCCSQNFVVEPEGAFKAMEYTAPMQPAELDVAGVRVKHWIDPEHSSTPISAAFLGNAKMLQIGRCLGSHQGRLCLGA